MLGEPICSDRRTVSVAARAVALVRIGLIAFLFAVSIPSNAARTYFNGFTGTWWNPARAGEGLVISELEGDLLLVAWFTYDPTRPGVPVYLTGAAPIVDDAVSVDVVATRGGRFGGDFDPALVERVPLGRLTLTLQSCNTMSLAYAGQGAGSGTIQLQRTLPLAAPLCEPRPRLAGEVYEGLRRLVNSVPVTGACTQATFNPDEATLSITTLGDQITMVVENFFNGQCRFRGSYARRDNALSGSGTYLCSEGLREGTWSFREARVGSEYANVTIALTASDGVCRQEVRFRGVVPP